MMKLPLKGVITPMATSLLGRDELDCAGLEKLVERIIAGGVNGIFILGTTGEGPALSYRLRRELITRTCAQVRFRVPVLVGITDSAFVESVNVARHAAEAGADALVLAPPYYMPSAQPELLEYLGHLLPELTLPLFLYNMPALTKVVYGEEILRWALDQSCIVGLKDSSKDMVYYSRAQSLIRKRPDWSILMGPEELLAESIKLGGDGGVPGGSNLFPQLYVRVCEAAFRGDFQTAEIFQAQIQRVSDAVYRLGAHSSGVVKGIKCVLSLLGVCNDFLAEPFHRFRGEQRAIMQHRLQELESQVHAVLSTGILPAPAPLAAKQDQASGVAGAIY